MVKGVSKQVILVKSPEPDLFEQAIFILRDGQKALTDEELLREAQKIANTKPKTKEQFSAKIMFWGIGIGASIMGALWLFSILSL